FAQKHAGFENHLAELCPGPIHIDRTLDSWPNCRPTILFLNGTMLYLWFLIIAVSPAPNGAPAKPWHFDRSALILRVLTDSQGALAGALRNELVDKLPSPLAEGSPGWGHTKRFGGRDKKQGKWRKIRVDALNPRDTLVIDVRDIRSAPDGSVAFSVFLSCDARVEYTEHVYEAGIRVFATSARARLRLHLQVDCQAVARLDGS